MNNKLLFLLAAAIIGLFLGACTLFRGPPTPLQTPTPNLTMTAIFSGIGVPTRTPPAAETATSLPTPVPPTATLLPTLTPFPPTATYTSTPLSPTETPGRAGGNFEAPFMNPPPVIDGVWDEWTSKAYPANAIVFGRNNWTGSADLEPSFRVAWDNTNLYLAVKVFDDVYVQNATGKDLFRGDSIELLFDNNLVGDFSVSSLNGDDYQLGVSPGNPDTDGAKEAYLWFPADQAGSRGQVQIGAVSSEGLYRIEFAVPWTILGVSPSAGQKYGFALSASDNDNLSENVQQTLASSAPNRMLTNPTTWGMVTLK